jgi:hypothetical protein
MLVAAGSLPARDERLPTLERWISQAIAGHADPGHRRALHGYAVWYHLRRLRGRTTAMPHCSHTVCPVRRPAASGRNRWTGWSIGRWKADFLEAGETALTAGRSRPSAREQQLEAEVAGLTQAPGEPRPGYGSGTSPRNAGCPLHRGAADPA